MEIIIDGKTYECFEKVEKKQDVILVPDNIEFEGLSGGGLGMKFDTDRLLYGSTRSGKYYVSYFSGSDKVSCKLTPIDRKDIQVGDWVYYGWNTELNCLFKDVTNYALCVGKDRFKLILDNNGLGFFELSLSFRDHKFWRVERV